MTLVRHRLLTPDGVPIVGQKVTALLMTRDDLADISYTLNVPDNSSFAGGVVRHKAVSTSAADGWLEWELAPNEFIYPGGTYYQMSGLGRSRTILSVFDSALPVDLSECRLDLVDFNSSNLVIVQGPRGRPGDEGATGNLSDTAVAGFVTTESSATRTAIQELVPDLAPDLATKVSTDTYNTGITQAKDRANHTGLQSAATISDLTEAVQDIVGAFFGAGTGVSVTYNDAQNSLTVSATGGTADPETVRDTIGAALIGVGAITVTINDVADTITISTTATANSTDAALRDRSTHTGMEPLSALPAGTTLTVLKSGGSWPARPTARADVVVAWKGPDPSPPIVSSGTGGMLDNVDYRLVTP